MKLTENEYKSFMGNRLKTKSKYHNEKTEIDGIKFDSIKEGAYYLKLKRLEKLKIIKDLKLQVPYELIPKHEVNGKTVRKCIYKADFVYKTTEDDKIHVVDTKGVRTDVYKIKSKLMSYKYGIEIEEV